MLLGNLNKYYFFGSANGRRRVLYGCLRPGAAHKGANAKRADKKAEAIAIMKNAKGATLPGIMEAGGWQKHLHRGAGPRSLLSKQRIPR
jgi:hypothetical protein